MRSILAMMAMAATAACTMPEDDGEGADPCNADARSGLIGTNIAAVTLPAALDHRIVKPDSAVTLDHRPERLNIHVDEDGVIQRLDCG